MKYNDIQEFEEMANEVFHEFLESMQGDNRFLKPDTEGYYNISTDKDVAFVYTLRGQRLAERMLKRLYKLGNRIFPDEYLNIESYLFQDCDN